jgi:aspartate-semialdehyde dehydrogenase
MATALESRRIVIAGASSLLGAELKALLEESRFAASDFRLVDEESVAGLLTEAGGEPAVIQPVEEDSFKKAWIIFFTGSAAFTKRNLELAKGSGARIVDLSGELAGLADVQSWLPKLQLSPGSTSAPHAGPYSIPSAPAEIIIRIASALASLKSTALTAVAFHPVSSSGGKAGIEELESQTGQLLSFQSLGKQVFDTQVAFTMLDRFGGASHHKLRPSLEMLRKEVRGFMPNGATTPAVQLLHAPVYYGTTVSACAFLVTTITAGEIMKACVEAGFSIAGEELSPSNVSSAGETSLQLSAPQPDAGSPGAWWFWAAADNLRLPASNAVKLAEKLLE